MGFPAAPGTGTGIDFNIDPQTGDWLVATADDITTAPAIPILGAQQVGVAILTQSQGALIPAPAVGIVSEAFQPGAVSLLILDANNALGNGEAVLRADGTVQITSLSTDVVLEALGAGGASIRLDTTDRIVFSSNRMGFYGVGARTRPVIMGIPVDQVLDDLLAALGLFGLIDDQTT